MIDLKQKDWISAGVLGAFWVIGVLVVNPAGDFPLNDDFSFAHSVYNLSELGKLEFDDWLDMTIITQVFWGAGFTKIFGFSFNVLRLSTLVAAYLGTLGLFFIARDLGQSKTVSSIAALSISFSPLLFSLSFTFMSDVPFFALCVWSFWAYNRAFASGKMKWVITGSLLAIAATFIRQLGFMLPAAFLFTWLLRKKFDLKNVLTAFLPLAITTLLYVRYNAWFEASQGLPETYGNMERLFKRLSKPDFLTSSFYRFGILAGYLGVFLLPLILAIGDWKIIGKKAMVKFEFSKFQGILFYGFLAFFLASLIPAFDKTFWGNIFYNFGLGPCTLKDGQFFMNVSPRFENGTDWPVKTFFSLSGIALIVSILPYFFRKLKRSSPHFYPAAFAFGNIILYGGFLMLDIKFFDRYFFQLLPFLMVIILPFFTKKLTRSRKLLCALGFVIVGGFSLLATHDYMSWNRARWNALNHLTENMKIPIDQIDGGFEFGGWHRPVKERSYGGGRSWWWVKNDNWAVTFGEMERHEKVMEFPYQRYLPPRVDSILILKKY